MTSSQELPPGESLRLFNLGFSDGWNGRTKKKNQGAQYLRSYERGVAARKQESAGAP